MTEPKLIEVPGIPGKLREQSIDEFLAVLAPDHLARQQLNEIRNQALKSVELSTQLMQANEKVIELQVKIMDVAAAAQRQATIEVIAPPIYQDTTVAAPPPPQKATLVIQDLGDGQGPKVFTKGPSPKAECPHCKKMITTSPGGWSSHQRNAHPDNQAPRPV